MNEKENQEFAGKKAGERHEKMDDIGGGPVARSSADCGNLVC